MTVVVFTGPTISAEEAAATLEAVYLPPAARGDLYRAARQRPTAIGLIDGLFERVLAVGHKEILWAMHRGIHVFGAASMGALRAAELSTFGMEGVGSIYTAYMSGTLEDDDEVAVRHGPADVAYRGQSEAMVNIRATLQAAESAGVLTVPTRIALESVAKDLFYAERSFPRVLELARAQGIPTDDLEVFSAWLPDNRVDQKRADALSMLELIRERLASGLGPKGVRFSFQYTIYFDRLKRSVDQGPATERFPLSFGTLLDEVRLAGRYTDVRRGAAERYLAIEEASRAGINPDEDLLGEAVAAFRREHRLITDEAFTRWLDENALQPEDADHFFVGNALQRWTEQTLEVPISAHFADYLRVSGEYPRLLARARGKQQALARRGLVNPSSQDVDCSDRDLLRWYFETRLGSQVPDDVPAYARSSGFTDRDAFLHALRREYLFLSLS